jgi:hypothetical protein
VVTAPEQRPTREQARQGDVPGWRSEIVPRMPYGGVAPEANSELTEARTRKREQCFVKIAEIVHMSEGVCGFYSCCAPICVRTLNSKQGYLVPMIIDTSTLTCNISRQNK